MNSPPDYLFTYPHVLLSVLLEQKPISHSPDIERAQTKSLPHTSTGFLLCRLLSLEFNSALYPSARLFCCKDIKMALSLRYSFLNRPMKVNIHIDKCDHGATEASDSFPGCLTSNWTI